jgi:hypothetical protein
MTKRIVVFCNFATAPENTQYNFNFFRQPDDGGSCSPPTILHSVIGGVEWGITPHILNLAPDTSLTYALVPLRPLPDTWQTDCSAVYDVIQPLALAPAGVPMSLLIAGSQIWKLSVTCVSSYSEDSDIWLTYCKDNILCLSSILQRNIGLLFRSSVDSPCFPFCYMGTSDSEKNITPVFRVLRKLWRETGDVKWNRKRPVATFRFPKLRSFYPEDSSFETFYPLTWPHKI